MLSPLQRLLDPNGALLGRPALWQQRSVQELPSPQRLSGLVSLAPPAPRPARSADMLQVLSAAAPPSPEPLYSGVIPKQVKAYVLNKVTEQQLELKRRHLPLLSPAVPRPGPEWRTQVELGRGEACFLRMQSALWSWRVHRQPQLTLHVEGPPALGRAVLFEERLGPLTVLQGGQITHLTDKPGAWGFTITSLQGQVFCSKEQFLLRHLPDGQVVLQLRQRMQINRLWLAAPLLWTLRWQIWRHYLKNVDELKRE